MRKFIFCKLQLIVVCIPAFAFSLHKKVPGNSTGITVQQWCVAEITLKSDKIYIDPLNDVTVEAVFTGPNGEKISRPAFWDGKNVFRVRFAPVQVGKWTMITQCNDQNNAGLNRISATVICKPYIGNLEIYKHGFLKVSKDGRYFTYNDGKPFLYLGDTHWLYIHERYFTSNKRGIPSQFKYVVDKRVAEGFTVYQSEAIQHPHLQVLKDQPYMHQRKDEEPICNLRDGLDDNDIPGFKNIDRKFQYIAQKGLVHANSSVCWALDPAEYPKSYTEKYMYQLGRYWEARYGAYPVLWTIAQEIDKNMYGHYDSVTIKKWFAVAQGIADNDAYAHPISAHMENTSSTTAADSWWGDKSFHKWWAVQWQDGLGNGIAAVGKVFWDHKPIKPSVLYESAYEGFWADAQDALAAGYKAFQSGMFGYGYGANGVWNDLYSNKPADYGTDYEMPLKYMNWFDGANLPAAQKLRYLIKFYRSIAWWKLVPRFGDQAWSSFADQKESYLASIGNKVFVVLFANKLTFTGTIKNLQPNKAYKAQWFNINNGTFTNIGVIKSRDGQYRIPNKPTEGNWVFVARIDKN